MTAFRSLDTWRGEGSFGAWMARIAVRVALRQLSRRRPVTRIDPLTVESDASADSRTPGDRASRAAFTAGALDAAGGQDPAAIALRGERESSVRAAVAGLEEPYREVVGPAVLRRPVVGGDRRGVGTTARDREDAPPSWPRPAARHLVRDGRPMSHRPFHPSELGDVADPLASADLLLMARELERLDGGPIRPSDGFTDRVLAAIGAEPLPAPMAVAGLAAREGRFGAMVAALRDTWHVAWSGGRPLAVRAQAMAFVLLLIVAVGSVGAVTTVGAFNALFPTTSSPSPTLPVANPSPQPAQTAEPTETPEPDRSPPSRPRPRSRLRPRSRAGRPSPTKRSNLATPPDPATRRRRSRRKRPRPTTAPTAAAVAAARAAGRPSTRSRVPTAGTGWRGRRDPATLVG